MGLMSGVRKGHRNVPKEGTKLRQAYDLLRTGGVFKMAELFGNKNYSRGIADLVDYYGVEVELVPLRKGYRMVGEWDGPTFVTIDQIIADRTADDDA